MKNDLHLISKWFTNKQHTLQITHFSLFLCCCCYCCYQILNISMIWNRNRKSFDNLCGTYKFEINKSHMAHAVDKPQRYLFIFQAMVLFYSAHGSSSSNSTHTFICAMNDKFYKSCVTKNSIHTYRMEMFKRTRK